MMNPWWQDNCNHYFRLWLRQAGGLEAEAQKVFDLKSASGKAILLFRYVELDVEFLGLKVPKVGFLISQNPSDVLDTEHKTKLPGIMVWNLV